MAKQTQAVKKKVRVTKSDIAQVRKSKTVDLSPNWSGHEDWPAERFQRFFWDAMDYYRLNSAPKDLKPAVIIWMEQAEYSKEDIAAFRKTNDWRCHLTMGALASCLLRGMPGTRADFNRGRSTVQALRRYIDEVIRIGRNDVEDQLELAEKKAKPVKPAVEDRTPNIQERIREIVNGHIGYFDEMQDQLRTRKINPRAYDYLTEKKVPAAMVGRIKEVFQARLAEWQQAQSGDDEQLKEGYSHWRAADFKKYLEFANSIVQDLGTYSQLAKTARRARVKKAPSKEKLVAKLKFCRDHAALKLVSVNPVDIVGSQQLWVYNVKTRKLGCYVAEDLGGTLSVKGSSIVGYKQSDSVQKTLRKPEVTIDEFRKANKNQLKKFLDIIKTTQVNLNGRISEDVVLLKVL
jgi:hypothetical protein